MLIAVGSLSKVKYNATLGAVQRLEVKCDVRPVNIGSGVENQPLGIESLVGARNRAKGAQETADADLGVGLEGGLLELLGSHYIGAVCCVVNRRGEEGMSTTPLWLAPGGLVKKLESGIELGDVMDEVTNSEGTKYSLGAVGILTGGKLTRTHAYEDAVVLALSRFVRPEVFNKLSSL
jgi:inosine/xanthosine triphosphatase